MTQVWIPGLDSGTWDFLSTANMGPYPWRSFIVAREQSKAQGERLTIDMIETLPRVAYFPDSFHEVNGVAHTSRHFEAFARRENLPFLCIRAGDRSENGAQAFIEDGNVWTLELPRGIFSFALEKDLRFDPAFPRHIPLIGEILDRFQPDLIHITGPSEVGMLGAGLSYHRNLPLAASWHTNVHEYLARRSDWLLRYLPDRHSQSAGQKIQDLTLAAAARFYSIAKVLFAPNIELCQLLESATGRPCFLMPRGVDTELFTPAKRQRIAGDDALDDALILGFVGRLSVEKNITLLATIHDELIAQGHTNFRFLIIGQGDEGQWLRDRMPQAEFPGVLRGEALAEAYASMDIFVFPSHTDTFGNVVLEALASGVPAIVTPDGGPRYIVREGETGQVIPDESFTQAIASLIANPAKLAAMRMAARAYALTASWDAVFEGVYEGYEKIVPVRQEVVSVAS